ncbi:MAG: nitroreductase family protein [Actinomycetota bacterium]|jgi:nitroreductase
MSIDAIEAIMTTRAIRRYTSEPVPDEHIVACLRAAQQAPSGGNVQPQQYVVVQDAATRAELGRLYREAYDRYERSLPDASSFSDPAQAAAWQRTRDASRHLADHLGDVPVVVVFLQPLIPWGSVDADGPLDIGRLDASVYPAVQNFCVAARALGLGTALTTVIRIRSAEVLALLGAPEGRFEIAALTPLGYPSGNFGVAPRKPALAVTHWDTWGAKRR